MNFNKKIIEKFQKLLDHDNFSTREGLKNLFKEDLFMPRYAITINKERDLALERLAKISENKLISVFDFSDNPKRILN